MPASRILIALGVIVAGTLAAWPFRQAPTRFEPPRQTPRPLDLTLRRPDSPPELAPRTEVSPAAGRTEATREPGNTNHAQGAYAASDLSNLVPPPALPVSFQPSATALESSDWRPEPIVWPAKPVAQPRPYRLRDGDTLEGIAERLLGSRERAAEIFALNHGVLTRPDLLPVGVTILLPPRQISDDLEPVGARR